MSLVQSLTAATFDRALADATTPVLVDFFASWCPPCKAIAPVLDELSVELAGRMTFFKVNVDEEPELAARFMVRSVPTLSLFAGSEQIYELPGYVPPAKLRTFLEQVARAGTGAPR